jgi:hypothetical protein
MGASQSSFGKKRLRRNKNVKKSKKRTDCKKELQKQIRKNISSGDYVSREQAIAVAYSQMRKKHPRCKQFKKQ